MLSVVVVVYKRAAPLRLCLEGIFGNSLTPYEVIVVNDGGSRNSRVVAEGFGCTIIDLPSRLGPSYARGVGAREAKGDILVFIDSDIVPDQDAFRKVEQRFTGGDSPCAVSGIISKETVYKNIWSRFMNSFMRYSFLSLGGN